MAISQPQVDQPQDDQAVQGTVPLPQEDPRRINVDPVVTPDPFVVSMDTTASQATPMSDETVDARAYKFDYGLREILKKSKEEIYQTLQSGDEDTLRSTAASEIDIRRRQETSKVIAEIAGRKGGDLTENEKVSLTKLIAEMSETTDPDVVMEQGYAKQLVSELQRFRERNDAFTIAAAYENPEAVAKIENTATDFASKRMAAQTIAENIQDEIKSQGWGGYLFDMAKTSVPGSTDYLLRGNVPGVGMIDGITLGENLDRQRARLYDLPTVKEFKAELKKITDDLRNGWLGGNPQVALDFAQSMVGMSQSESAMKSLMLPIDFAGTGLATGAVKGVRAGIKGTNTLLVDTSKAFKDVVEAGTRPGASKSTVLDAAGDLQEAAVVKSTVNLSDDLTGRPRATERAIEALTSTFRTDLEDFKAGSQGGSRELVNRVQENSETVLRNVMEAAETFKRVERLPDVMARESAVRLIVDDIKDMYPTLKNSILDINKPYKETVSSNWLVDMNLGKNDGTYFSSREVAQNYIDFHKLGGVTIEEGKDAAKAPKVYYLPESAVKNVGGRANENFGYEITAAGKPTFFSDIVNRIEVTPSLKPEKGLIPVEVKDQTATFGNKLQTATVEQQGLGYYVKLTVPVPENSQVMRSLIAETGYTKIPDSPVKTFLTSVFGKFRSPESTLSAADRANRLTVTYGLNSYFNILKNNVSEIGKLKAGRFSKGRQRWEEWQRMVEYADQKIDPLSSKPGYFYKSQEDMTTDWVQVLGRLPDEQEVAAYFEFKRGMEIDRMFRNIAAVRNQQRVGAMTNSVVALDAAGKEVTSAEFSGISRRSLPGGDGNVLIMDKKLGEERVVNLKRMSSEDKAYLTGKIARGEGKLVELYDPERRPFNGFGSLTDQRVQYVYSETISTRPLDWNQVPRRGGGHLQYDYDRWIKQAKMRKSDIPGDASDWYEGDTTIMGIQFQSQGKEIVKALNEVRLALRGDNVEAAKAAGKKLPIDWDILERWFKGGKDEKGAYHPPMLSLSEPIQIVENGKSLSKSAEQRYKSFKDGTRQNSLARQQQIEFGQERDSVGLLGLEDIGTAGKPLYQVGPAKTVDPITTMQRGLQRIIKSNFYDDYKTTSVEHWLKQAGPYLEASPNEIRYSPFYYYNEAKFSPSAPADVVARLKTAKYHIDQIVGIPSENHNLLYQYSQQMADWVYQKTGPNSLINIAPDWLLPKLKDPFAAARSFVFHPVMGLYNIAQFVVQMGGYGNIYGIAGAKYAAPGSLAAQFHFWTRANSHPNIIKHLDDLAVKAKFPGASNWKPGEFTEAFNLMRQTGFGLVGKEAALVDDVMSVKVIENGWNKFLDMGTMFFKGGEENVRNGAFYTAYREFRDRNPIGRITDRDRSDILQRADLLNINMSRASATALNKGVFSVPMQFYSYQQRLLSLFFSDRITGKERARLLAYNSAMYGVPMAVGVTGIPAVDTLRQYALDNGYVVGDNFWTSLFMEGIPSALGALATGKGDAQAGTWYDVGNRFGTKGLEFIGNAAGTDKSMLDIVGGAAYNFAKTTYASSDGLRRAIFSLVKRDGDVFPMTPEDVIEVARQVSILNSAWRVYAASATGRWMSKNEAYLTEGSPGQAILAGLTGLKDQDINDIQTKRNALKNQENYEKEVEKQFAQEFHRGMLAHKNNDHTQGEKFLTRAQAWLEIGNFREDRISSIVSKALDDDRSILDKINMDYYIRKIPNNTAEAKADALRRYEQIREKKNINGSR